jgi:hypothetical protein
MPIMFRGHSALAHDRAQQPGSTFMRVLTRVPRKIFAAALVAGGLTASFAPTPADAQFFYHPHHRPMQFYFNLGRPHHYEPPVVDELTPRDIVMAVSRYGFSDISRPRYEDDVAVVTATGRDGRRLRIEVDDAA